MATDLQYREGLTDTQKNQLVTRLDRIKGGSSITDTDKKNFNYGLGNSWESYLVPNTLSADDVNNSKDITPVNPTDPNAKANAVVGGIWAMNTEDQNQLTAQQQKIQDEMKYRKDAEMLQGVNTAETDFDTSVSGLETLRTKEQDKNKALAEAYKTGGVPEYQKQLDALKQQQAQFRGSYLQGLTDVEGKVIPMRFITGQQAQMDKTYAMKSATIALEQQALQGNIENAKGIAQEMVDLEYGDIEAQIKNQQELIDLNYKKLTREDQKRADELKYVLDARLAEVAEEKALELNKQNLLIQLAPKGIDTATANKIKNAKTDGEFFDAIMAAAPYLKQAEDTKGDWSIFEDADGNKMMIEKNTGTIRPVTVDSSKNYFTDANGTAWNMDGWAVDPSKAQQMQAISDRIGKLTDENLETKVKQFTPGLTADMVRKTSAKTGVSWEALLTMVTQEATVGGQMSNVANKNNNFGGLTWSENTQWKDYGGVKGTSRPGAEGGNYIKFPTKQAGLDAMGALMAQYGTVVPQTSKNRQEALSIVERVFNGEITEEDAYKRASSDAVKKELTLELAKMPAKENEIKDYVAQEKLNTIDSLKNHKALDTAVGPNFLVRGLVGGQWDLMSGNAKDFVATTENLLKGLTLQELIEAKEKGATFGALSNAELEMLANSASKLTNFRVTLPFSDDVIGYNSSEKVFKEELDRIQTLIAMANQRVSSGKVKIMADGTYWEKLDDGTYKKI